MTKGYADDDKKAARFIYLNEDKQDSWDITSSLVDEDDNTKRLERAIYASTTKVNDHQQKITKKTVLREKPVNVMNTYVGGGTIIKPE